MRAAVCGRARLSGAAADALRVSPCAPRPAAAAPPGPRCSASAAQQARRFTEAQRDTRAGSNAGRAWSRVRTDERAPRRRRPPLRPQPPLELPAHSEPPLVARLRQAAAPPSAGGRRPPAPALAPAAPQDAADPTPPSPPRPQRRRRAAAEESAEAAAAPQPAGEAAPGRAAPRGRRKRRVAVRVSPRAARAPAPARGDAVSAAAAAAQDDYRAAMQHAAGMLESMPRRWASASSVIRDALRPPPEALPEPDPAPSLGPGGETTALVPAAPAPAQDVLARLHDAVRRLEELALASRRQLGQTKLQLDSSQAYLDLIRAAPSAIEAAWWLDEVETLRPEWVTATHFEDALMRMSAYFPGPAPERDIMLLWLKARKRGMATPRFYSRLLRRIGTSTLREVAFPLVWAAARLDLGLETMPPEVMSSVLRNCAYLGDMQRGVDTWLELAQAGAPVAKEPTVLLELLGLLASRGYDDQDVYDYVFAELQEAVGTVIARDGPAGVPAGFFELALRVGDANSALRLWYFMVSSGLSVSYRDYFGLMQALVNERRTDEAEELYQYLAREHPELLYVRRGALVRQLMRLYAKLKDYSQCAYLFATHFDTTAEAPLEASPAEYMMLLQSLGSSDAQTAHHLWREMLSRGFRLEARHYDQVFAAMGGAIAPISRRIPYSIPASELDKELPRQLVEQGEQASAEHDAPPALQPQLPPPHSDPYTWDPRSPLPVPAGNDNRDIDAMRRRPLVGDPGRSGPQWFPERGTNPFLAKPDPAPGLQLLHTRGPTAGTFRLPFVANALRQREKARSSREKVDRVGNIATDAAE
eukprot:TRINITY_DN5027_c1_g2_i2.p1 TRINITY_DN5027_c1_g2~~TRINITY_DN5027_c1_g2_i2.p1  ORF type:complete len:837 (+),score=244.52 TRINITY_DN5027_c1_g2_i2:67-2511(+)